MSGEERQNEEALREQTVPKFRKRRETHLWSDGFSRDSGLKGAGEKVNGMQCERKGPQGKREGRKDVVNPLGNSQTSLDSELQKALTYLLDYNIDLVKSR